MNESSLKLYEVAASIGEEPQLALQAYYQLRTLYNLLNKIGTINIESMDVRTAYYGVLYALKDGKSLSSSELSQKLLSGLSNLTTLIDRMERDGLVERTHDKKDRRKTLLKLTEEGERASQIVIPAHLEWITKTMGVFSDDELEEFCGLLEILWKELIKQAEEDKVPSPSVV